MECNTKLTTTTTSTTMAHFDLKDLDAGNGDLGRWYKRFKHEGCFVMIRRCASIYLCLHAVVRKLQRNDEPGCQPTWHVQKSWCQRTAGLETTSSHEVVLVVGPGICGSRRMRLRLLFRPRLSTPQLPLLITPLYCFKRKRHPNHWSQV